MTDVYSKCPTFEDDKYLLRFVEEKDADDLLIGTNDGYAYNGYWKRQK